VPTPAHTHHRLYLDDKLVAEVKGETKHHSPLEVSGSGSAAFTGVWCDGVPVTAPTLRQPCALPCASHEAATRTSRSGWRVHGGTCSTAGMLARCPLPALLLARAALPLATPAWPAGAACAQGVAVGAHGRILKVQTVESPAWVAWSSVRVYGTKDL
jgi:hypothetical protein